MDDLPFPTKLRQLSRICNGALIFPIIICISLHFQIEKLLWRRICILHCHTSSHQKGLVIYAGFEMLYVQFLIFFPYQTFDFENQSQFVKRLVDRHPVEAGAACRTSLENDRAFGVVILEKRNLIARLEY